MDRGIKECYPAGVQMNGNKKAAVSHGQMEQIEFKILPDGQVEEMVRGVKGDNCNKVTEEINQALGKVIASQPTEEKFEQPIVLENTLTQSLGEVVSGDSWEGQSSW